MVTGDVTQVDLPQNTRSGLIVIQEILQGIVGVEFSQLDARDVSQTQDRAGYRRGLSGLYRSGQSVVMEVFVANEQETPVPEARLSALARHALDFLKVDEDAELSVLFVSPSHMHLLNQRFANEDKPTDVLAFPMMEDEEERGAVVGRRCRVPGDCARQRDPAENHSYERELEVLLVHGTLHLLGYDHHGPTDKSRMDDCLGQIIESFTSAT